MSKSNRTKVQMFRARQRQGDINRLVEITGYSQPHVSNVLRNFRTNSSIVDAAYRISFRRKKNSELVNS